MHLRRFVQDKAAQTCPRALYRARETHSQSTQGRAAGMQAASESRRPARASPVGDVCVCMC